MRSIFLKTLTVASLGLSISLFSPVMAQPYGHGFHRGGHHRFGPVRWPYFGPCGPFWGPRFGLPLPPPPVFNDGWGWGWGPGYWYGGNGLGTRLVVGELLGGAVGMEVASSAHQVVSPVQINVINAPVYPPPPPELPPAPPWFQPVP